MRRRAPLDEQLGQRCQYVFVFELARDDECQALPARLVDNGKDAELASVMGAFLDEVVSPDMSCPLLSGPSTMTVWIEEGTTNASEEAQARGDHRQAA